MGQYNLCVFTVCVIFDQNIICVAYQPDYVADLRLDCNLRTMLVLLTVQQRNTNNITVSMSWSACVCEN